LQQAKDADRLGPKGTWSVQGLKPSLSWTNDHRRRERTFPILANKRNTVSPYRSLWEDKPQGESIAVRVDDLVHVPHVPGLDLPGLDIVSAARGFGCAGVLTRTNEEIKEAFGAALSANGPTVIVIPIAHEDRPLVPPVSD
jgi:Thiamine pyrophosphate enzyme, C-terminal TPP binding domain